MITVEKRGVISPSISVVRNCELITRMDSLLDVSDLNGPN